MAGDLNSLPPAALAAAMRSGTAEWRQRGSVRDHALYLQPVQPKSRRRCHCGCKTRATHLGMANGVALKSGCELSVRRWVRARGRPAPTLQTGEAQR